MPNNMNDTKYTIPFLALVLLISESYNYQYKKFMVCLPPVSAPDRMTFNSTVI